MDQMNFDVFLNYLRCHLSFFCIFFITKNIFNPTEEELIQNILPQIPQILQLQLFQDFKTAVDIINKTDDVQVVVLTGRGNHFCAALDLKEAPLMFQFPDDLDQARKSIRISDLLKDWQQSMTSLSRIKVPVIVVIQGYCLGGGLDLTDIKYCSQDAKLSIKEIDFAVVIDIGTLQRQVASKSPIGCYTIKSIPTRGQNLDQHLDVITRTNMAMLFTNDIPIAITSSMTKTKLEYPKLQVLYV